MPSSSLMWAKSPSRPKRTTDRFMCQCATPDLESLLPIRPSCFRSFSRPTMQSPERRAAPAWGLRYRSASLRCTAAKSGSSRNQARARHLRSRSRFTLSDRWSKHDQAHSVVVDDQADNRQIIREGALMVYGTSVLDVARRLAVYVD